MKRAIKIAFQLFFSLLLSSCTLLIFAQKNNTSLVNLSHLNHLYVPVKFADGTTAAGVYIYAEAPDYHFVNAAGEGFICVDDVARAVLIYVRSPQFFSDTSVQHKAVDLLKFIIKMQSANGYFYNFLFENGTINKTGKTSVNKADWWSWRALQSLVEAEPFIKKINVPLANTIDNSIHKLIKQIKIDFINLPLKTKFVHGIHVPEWLPAGSGTDQSALLIVSLIAYSKMHNDKAIKSFIKKLADGIMMMQAGDANHFPYSCFLSWENNWHAYGNLQAYALLKAGVFFSDSTYTNKAMNEVNNFYPWLLKHGYFSSFAINKQENNFKMISQEKYDQIAYGIEPMFFAAEEAYKETHNNKYADMAGHIAAWFFGANDANKIMYSTSTGICYDGIKSSTEINFNSGAESTIEALLVLQQVDNSSAIKNALSKYRKK